VQTFPTVATPDVVSVSRIDLPDDGRRVKLKLYTPEKNLNLKNEKKKIH
jgi:hypothetical protein